MPARIAILDTGVEEGYAKYIKCYKDFANPKGSNHPTQDHSSRDSPQDNTGHGTTAVRLVLKIYNKAEVYVARVFEKSQATSKTADLMAQVSDCEIKPHDVFLLFPLDL